SAVLHPSDQRGVVEWGAAEDPGPAGRELPSIEAGAAVCTRAWLQIAERSTIPRSDNSESFSARVRWQPVRCRIVAERQHSDLVGRRLAAIVDNLDDAISGPQGAYLGWDVESLKKDKCMSKRRHLALKLAGGLLVIWLLASYLLIPALWRIHWARHPAV